MPKFSKSTGYKMKGWGGYQKSPLKEKTAAEQIRARTAARQKLKLKQQELELQERELALKEAAKKDKTTTQKQKEQKITEEYKPWGKKAKEVHRDPDMEEGWDYESDSNIGKYKTKEEIKQDRKDARLQSKLLESPGGEKRTSEERYKDKMNLLEDKLQRAKGTGASGVSFNWKDMLLGGDIASGFKVEPKKDILARKIKKKETKKAARDLRKERRLKRKKLKAEKKGVKQENIGREDLPKLEKHV